MAKIDVVKVANSDTVMNTYLRSADIIVDLDSGKKYILVDTQLDQGVTKTLSQLITDGVIEVIDVVV